MSIRLYLPYLKRKAKRPNNMQEYNLRSQYDHELECYIHYIDISVDLGNNFDLYHFANDICKRHPRLFEFIYSADLNDEIVFSVKHNYSNMAGVQKIHISVCDIVDYIKP